MWKSIGNVKSGDDVSIRSNKSRVDINVEPFHQSLKRRSNISPEANRSFCQNYLQKRRNATLNASINSNKSDKNLQEGTGKDDIFTEMRKVNKEDGASRFQERGKENPQTERNNIKKQEQLKTAATRLHTLKKDHTKLKNTIQNEFNSFKNMFYQIQERLHQNQQPKTPPSDNPVSVDQQVIKEILTEARGVQRYFQQMDRKKATLMQRLAQ